MKHTCTRGAAALFVTLIGLSGCGGGGGGSSGSGNNGSDGEVSTYPASGAYGWVLKSSGPTDALKYGLSLVHPSQTDTEYVIESASLNVTDARLLSSGSVDTGALRVTSVKPHSLVYIVGGDIRVVPMQANGAKPAAKLQPDGTSSACRFLISANDFATPLNSRYVISTVGGDGDCDTTDDGRAEVRLNSDGTPILTVLTGDAPLDVVRDPATLAPRGWIYPRNVVLWNTSSSPFEVRASDVAAISSVVSSTYRQALVEDGARLSVINFSGGSSFTETPLDATDTAGTGWQPIGYDADSFYVYRNSENTFNATFTVLRITRTNPAATVVTSGSGLISLASLGSNVIYLTVLRQADNRLLRVNKTGGAPTETVTPTTTFTSLQTSSSGVHQLWRVTNVGSASATYTIEFINESSSTPLLPPISGGYPINVADAGTENFNTSESRTRFIYASGFTASRAFNGATLETYDAASATSRVLGALPASTDFGSDFGVAAAIGGPSGVGAAFAARSSGGSIQQTGAKVYSFDLGTANSLKATSKVIE